MAVINRNYLINELVDSTINEYSGNVRLIDNNNQTVFSTGQDTSNKNEKVITVPFSYKNYFPNYRLKINIPSSYQLFLPFTQTIFSLT